MSSWDRNRAENMLKLSHEIVVMPTLDEFHEWCVLLATKAITDKTSNDYPVSCFAFQRRKEIQLMNVKWESDAEKQAIFGTVRMVCQHDKSVTFVCHMQEIYLTVAKTREEMDAALRKYGQVRRMPDRVDGLMVASYSRAGDVRISKWEVRLKRNPADNRLLARDDMDMSGAQWRGQATHWFGPATDAEDIDDGQ